MADWTPLTDEDPIPGDPAALTSFVAGLRGDMRELWNVVGELQGINAAGIWSGEAAEAFTRRREGVVPDLDRVANRLDRTAFALETFGQAVQESHFKALAARTKARAAQETITGAQLRNEEAANQEGASITPDWKRVVTNGEEEMAAARHLFDQACEVYVQAETRCDKLLSDAIHDDLADPKKRGFLGSFAHAVGNIADHFTDLKKFSELMGATAAICGVAALFPPLAFLEPVALAASGLKLLADFDLAATDRQGWGEFAMDAVGFGFFVAGRVATVGARGAVAEKAVDRLEMVKNFRAAGRVDELTAMKEGELLTGRRAAQFYRSSSRNLIREFGADRSMGRLPDWRRSMYAIRHLDLELPDARTLAISRRAVTWAVVAGSETVVSSYSDAREVAEHLAGEEADG